VLLHRVCGVSIPEPDASTRWRCSRCGNLTRFDVERSERTREFWHFSLAGEAVVEESTRLSGGIEAVRCRWCGATSTEGALEVIARPDSA
jgi:hypothetical protein